MQRFTLSAYSAYFANTVVITTAVFVVSDYQQRLLPDLRAVERGIDFAEKFLAERNIINRVLAVAFSTPHRFKERVVSECSILCSRFEIVELSEVILRCIFNIRNRTFG